MREGTQTQHQLCGCCLPSPYPQKNQGGGGKEAGLGEGTHQPHLAPADSATLTPQIWLHGPQPCLRSRGAASIPCTCLPFRSPQPIDSGGQPFTPLTPWPLQRSPAPGRDHSPAPTRHHRPRARGSQREPSTGATWVGQDPCPLGASHPQEPQTGRGDAVAFLQRPGESPTEPLKPVPKVGCGPRAHPATTAGLLQPLPPAVPSRSLPPLRPWSHKTYSVTPRSSQPSNGPTLDARAQLRVPNRL